MLHLSVIISAASELPDADLPAAVKATPTRLFALLYNFLSSYALGLRGPSFITQTQASPSTCSLLIISWDLVNFFLSFPCVFTVRQQGCPHV